MIGRVGFVIRWGQESGPEQPILQPFTTFLYIHFLSTNIVTCYFSPFILIPSVTIFQTSEQQNTPQRSVSSWPPVRRHLVGGGHRAPVPAPRGGDLRTKPAISVPGSHVRDVWQGQALYSSHLLLIRLRQIFSNLLVLIWRDEASSNIGDRSGSRIVILSVTSPASPTFWTSEFNQE